MPSTWTKKWDKWDRYDKYPYEKWNWWDSWEPRAYGQKPWHRKSERPQSKDWEGERQDKPQRIEPREAEETKDAETKDDSKVEGNPDGTDFSGASGKKDIKNSESEADGVGSSSASRSPFLWKGGKGKDGKDGKDGKGKEASDNWPPQPDYMCDPGWFAWSEMAWAYGAEAYDWGDFRPWDKEKSGEVSGKDTENMEKLASEWEGWPQSSQPSFGKRHELVPKKANLKEQFEKTESKSVTTLMLRNVPNAYDRETLMEELDHLGFAGCFNFLYLPIDSATKNNVGYAFVNFNDEKTSDDCMNNMSGYFFKGQPYNRRRAAIVSVAHLQGLEANLEHYSRTQVFFAPLPCQRPWVAPSAAKELLDQGCSWAPCGFAKLVEDAAVRPGTEQDDQSFNRNRLHRDQNNEQWWGTVPGFEGFFDFQSYEMIPNEMMYDMYASYFDFEGVPPGLLENGAPYHQVLTEEDECKEPKESKDSVDKAGDLVDALSQMLRTGSQVPVDDEEGDLGEVTMMGELKQMQSMGWFGWEFFDGMERSCSTAVNSHAPPSDDQSPSFTNGSLVLTNVPLTTTEWDLRQIIEHVGVHAPITVKFEPGATSDINQVTLHFRNMIDLEIADVTLRESSYSTEDGGARIQILRSGDGPGTWGSQAMPVPWRVGSSWFAKDDEVTVPTGNGCNGDLGHSGHSSSPEPNEPSFGDKEWPKLPSDTEAH